MLSLRPRASISRTVTFPKAKCSRKQALCIGECSANYSALLHLTAGGGLAHERKRSSGVMAHLLSFRRVAERLHLGPRRQRLPTATCPDDKVSLDLLRLKHSSDSLPLPNAILFCHGNF